MSESEAEQAYGKMTKAESDFYDYVNNTLSAIYPKIERMDDYVGQGDTEKAVVENISICIGIGNLETLLSTIDFTNLDVRRYCYDAIEDIKSTVARYMSTYFATAKKHYI